MSDDPGVWSQAAEETDEIDLGDDWEPCHHEHEPDCFDYDGRVSGCYHEHCWNCGGCGCPGYCDDYQTYNLRPSETGGAAETAEAGQ